jgi:rod shape determining protein RodA
MIDVRVWMGLAYPAYALALLLLLGVEIAGETGKGATRWISFGPLSLQPSEVMKIALVLALARYLHSRPKSDLNHPFTLVPALLMILVPVTLVMHQPDLGTAMLLLLSGAGLLFLGGLSWWYLGGATVAGLAAVPIAWRVLKDYQKDRILTFLDPSRDPMGAGYHTLQAKIGLGSGGLAGKGFLHSSQARLDYLPEKHTDFIFTILGEEFGFVGTLTLLTLYALIVFYGVMIAFNSRSQFGRMLAMGVCLTLLLYVLINTAMVVGLIPVVGVPLPLVSYGGTAIMTIMFGMGLLMSVHVHRHVDMARN